MSKVNAFRDKTQAKDNFSLYFILFQYQKTSEQYTVGDDKIKSL